ncbi:MAG: LuxR C-terminal-related transcriptional regulator [Lachnoclostridium sp.]|jgi:LuxR family maltose regulon positive regulatory protein|nr:LuxR C-terminal-related transcriptional regulator [Lachnoclostridium sp.]
MLDRSHKIDRTDCLIRLRINALLDDAVKSPLTIIYASSGCGKTCAVSQFTSGTSYSSSWIHFSERDNAGSRFWSKYIQAAADWSPLFIEQCRTHGFPDTEDKINRHLSLRKQYAPSGKRLIILDDIHLITHPSILNFMEQWFLDRMNSTAIILICRKMPEINLFGLQIRGLIPTINEDALRFTESELSLYLQQQGLTVSKKDIRKILEDTHGWSFSINLTARSLKKAPGYEGYVRIAMKQSIFKMMEEEVFNRISKQLQKFLIRLSLIEHLPEELIMELSDHNNELLTELECQNTYIRFDSDINAYHIHHLFLDFLHGKISILTKEDKENTYQIAAGWCARNDFELDALGYYEKIKDYESIISILRTLPAQMSYDIALCAADILERACDEYSDRIYFFAVMHVRIISRLGRLQESIERMNQYEKQFLSLPKDNDFRNKTLGAVYYNWGNVRALMSTVSNDIDFDRYYLKMNECLTKSILQQDQYANLPIGFWASLAGSSKKDAPIEYIEAASRTVKYVSQCWKGATMGIDVLCQGELLFYQGNIKTAEIIMSTARSQARENNQFETEHKALFYLLRLALGRGDYKKSEQILKEMEARNSEKSYAHRFLNYDIATAWYYCSLKNPGMVPSWLQEDFSSYAHAYFIENTGNQIKARFHFLTKNYPPLLTYIEEMKKRESILYGRVEMLAFEACVHFLMKNRGKAILALQSAYQSAYPNDILIPFVELGNHMRTLVSYVMRKGNSNIPCVWLEKVKRKAASYAKYQSAMISQYEKENGSYHHISLSLRERDVLADLYHGLSRPEIAAKQSLSINTVNSVTNNIFNKLGAESIADAVRITAEENLLFHHHTTAKPL